MSEYKGRHSTSKGNTTTATLLYVPISFYIHKKLYKTIEFKKKQIGEVGEKKAGEITKYKKCKSSRNIVDVWISIQIEKSVRPNIQQSVVFVATVCIVCLRTGHIERKTI